MDNQPAASEETPLLSHTTNEHNDVYNRFSRSKKILIVAIVSWSGLIPRELSDYAVARKF